LPAATGLVRAEPGRPAPAAPVVGVTLALATTGGAGRLVLAEVAADGTVGPARTVAVPAKRSVGIPVTAGTAALLIRADDTAAPVVASLVVSAADAAGPLLSVQPVRPGSRAAGSAPVVTEDLRAGLVAVR
ncbi:MAG TPA: hypothetical protein VFP72_10310, partial [Kineosporiaceae bacterium]|nr:hypothetical protein [Kineosporiaceae bacterium]